MNSKKIKLVFSLMLLSFLIVIQDGRCADTSNKQPKSYMPKKLNSVAIKTCQVNVSGKADCSPRTLGEAAPDSARLGFAMMSAAGMKGSDDKRWDHVVYGVSAKTCKDGGTSVGAMLTDAGLSKPVQKEFNDMIASKKMPIEKLKIEGVDVYVGHLTGEDCILAVGYPNDRIVLLAYAAKDEKEKVKSTMKAMLLAAKTSK